MKRCIWTLLAVVGVAPLSAGALTITPLTPICGTATCLKATGPETSQAQIDAILLGLIGTDQEIYKENVGDGFDTGALAGSYQTTFSNTPADPSEALIEYVGGPVANAGYLLVKDGNQNPAWYLFLLNWNGTEDLVLEGFWPNQGAISHVALYGGQRDCCTREVPEPASLSLLGGALIGLGILRRRRRFPG